MEYPSECEAGMTPMEVPFEKTGEEEREGAAHPTPLEGGETAEAQHSHEPPARPCQFRAPCGRDPQGGGVNAKVGECIFKFGVRSLGVEVTGTNR